MHKVFAIGVAIYLAGDPALGLLGPSSTGKDLIVASVLALIAVPWVIAYFDK